MSAIKTSCELQKLLKLTLFLGTSILKTFLKIINLGSIAGRHLAKGVELSAGYFPQKEQIKFRSKKSFSKLTEMRNLKLKIIFMR